MTTHHLFYLALLSQVILISLYLPSRILSRLRYVVNTYPPSDYPKLYTVPLESVERTQRLYGVLNAAIFVIGVALVAVGFRSPGQELLNWDDEAVTFVYWMLQMSPLLLATRPGFTYFNLRRRGEGRSMRSATLRPRRLFDFVSPATVGLSLFVYVAFVSFVIFVQALDHSLFPGFGGYWNVAGVTFVYILFAGVIYRQLHGKKCDPYQDDEDRLRQMGFSIKLLVVSSIVATLFITLNLALSAFDLRELATVFHSVYLQLASAASVYSFRVDKVNFEVYRQDPLST